MGNLDRRQTTEAKRSCAVCGTTDGRMLASTRLLNGERIVVCGSHKTAHHRSEQIAESVEQLRKLVGERRRSA